jgi:hypothetical protein
MPDGAAGTGCGPANEVITTRKVFPLWTARFLRCLHGHSGDLRRARARGNRRADELCDEQYRALTTKICRPSARPATSTAGNSVAERCGDLESDPCQKVEDENLKNLVLQLREHQSN